MLDYQPSKDASMNFEIIYIFQEIIKKSMQKKHP